MIELILTMLTNDIRSKNWFILFSRLLTPQRLNSSMQSLYWPLNLRIYSTQETALFFQHKLHHFICNFYHHWNKHVCIKLLNNVLCHKNICTFEKQGVRNFDPYNFFNPSTLKGYGFKIYQIRRISIIWRTDFRSVTLFVINRSMAYGFSTRDILKNYYFVWFETRFKTQLKRMYQGILNSQWFFLSNQNCNLQVCK